MESHPEEIKGLTLAHGYILGYKFNPIFDGDSIVGTNIVFVSEADLAGSIPKFVIKKVQPKVMSEYLHDLV